MILNKIPRIKLYLSIKVLFLSFFINSKKSENFLILNFKKVFNKKYVHLTSMCRVGFIIILEYLKKKNPTKNEIIICSYNLKEMIDIPRILNFKIKLIDIQNETGFFNIKKISSYVNKKTAAILLTNIFNNYEDSLKVKKIAKKNDILLIEDNAIYYNNFKKIRNRKKFAGSIGDVSILSFGIMKNISALFGGAILTDSKEINKFIENRIKKLNKFSLVLFSKQVLLFLSLKLLLSKIIYNLIFFYIIKMSHLKRINFFLKKLYPAEYFIKKKTNT